ncbi:MAG: putative nucleic acid-binding protein [Gammaproteobacteria bacterium]
MAFLLDTESFFALLKPEPELHPVIAWKREVRNEQVFVSVISVGELVDAIAAVRSPVVRKQWESRLHEHLPNAFHARILDVDLNTAREWGLVRGTQSAGELLSTEESLLIATARVNGFSLLTRRAVHHQRLGVSVIDPYSRSQP